MNLDKEKNGVGSNPASFFFLMALMDGWTEEKNVQSRDIQA